jgi:hypothetical protein
VIALHVRFAGLELLKISDLALELLNPLLLSTGGTRRLVGIDLARNVHRRNDSAPASTLGPIAWQAAYTARYSSK